MKKLLIVLICAILCILPYKSYADNDIHLKNYFTLQESAVSVIIFYKDGSGAFCSGIMITEDENSSGFLTAKHCVEGDIEKILINFKEQVSYYIASPNRDIAYLELDHNLFSYDPIKIASYNAKYKDIVYFLGYPTGNSYFEMGLVAWNTLNNGYIFSKAINGCSGAGAINNRGQLVGILWGIITIGKIDITIMTSIESIRPFLIQQKLWNKLHF
ncbi:MAG: serine protease [Candidatus Thorarchaeota archaeon]|jgi:hypothetical protein